MNLLSKIIILALSSPLYLSCMKLEKPTNPWAMVPDSYPAQRKLVVGISLDDDTKQDTLFERYIQGCQCLAENPLDGEVRIKVDFIEQLLTSEMIFFLHGLANPKESMHLSGNTEGFHYATCIQRRAMLQTIATENAKSVQSLKKEIAVHKAREEELANFKNGFFAYNKSNLIRNAEQQCKDEFEATLQALSKEEENVARLEAQKYHKTKDAEEETENLMAYNAAKTQFDTNLKKFRAAQLDKNGLFAAQFAAVKRAIDSRSLPHFKPKVAITTNPEGSKFKTSYSPILVVEHGKDTYACFEGKIPTLMAMKEYRHGLEADLQDRLAAQELAEYMVAGENKTIQDQIDSKKNALATIQGLVTTAQNELLINEIHECY